MCSKKFIFTKYFWNMIGVVCLSFFLSYCAGEEEAYLPPKEINISRGSEACLENFSQTLDYYFEGKLSKEEVESFWDCADSAIETFLTYVRGAEKDRYRAKEIRFFFHKYFLGETRITDELLDEAMNVKRLFLGGNTKVVSRDELVRGRELFRKLRNMSLRLYPHIEILSLNHKDENGQLTPPSKERFEIAINELEVAFVQLASLMTWNETDYSFSSLKILLEELQKLVEEKSNKRPIDSYVPLIAQAKLILMGDSVEFVLSREWNRLMSIGAQFVKEYLRFSYYVDRENWDDKLGADHLNHLTNSVVGIFKGTLIYRGVGEIPQSEIHDFITLLAEQGLLPFDLTAEDGISTWEAVINKLLVPLGPGGGNLKTKSGLTSTKLDVLLSEFNRWHEIQRYINDLNVIEVVSDATKEMDRLLSGPWTLKTDEHNRVVIDGDTKSLPNLSAMTLLNLGRMIVRLVVRGYSKSAENRFKLTGLTTTELQEAYLDLRPLLAGIGLVDPDNNDFYKRIFRESNVFLPRSDGDHLVSFEEGNEYFFYVMSGIKAGDYIIDEMRKVCRVEEDLEDGSISVEVKCFRKEFRAQFQKFEKHLPGLVASSQGFSEEQWRGFLNDLEKTVRSDADPNDPMASGDIKEMQILLKYIETLMQRWDQDGDQKITLGEGLSMFPVFQKTLGDLFETDDEDTLLVFFTFMLRYGRAPDPGDALDGLRHLNWRLNREHWQFSTERPEITRILSSLSAI